MGDVLLKSEANPVRPYDSSPEAEDRECHLKATGFFRTLGAR